MTPASVTTQEEDKQTVALVFADVLKAERPQMPCLTLSETLNAINQGGLSEAYRHMYIDYRETGIMNKDLLKKVGEVTKTRYITQINLAGFNQSKNDRFSIFGMRILNTEHAQIRLFVQIWDSEQGIIVWEGSEELSRSEDTFTERSVTLRRVLEQAAQNLIKRLPEKNGENSDSVPPPA